MRFSGRLPPLSIPIAVLVVLFAALLSFLFSRHQPKPDERLVSPAFLLHQITTSGSPVFATTEFLPFVTTLSAAQQSLFPSTMETKEVSRDTSAFWKLNRGKHYSALLIGVNPAWRPLVNSLLDSPLWILSDVSPWGYLFRPRLPESVEWQLPSQEELEKVWPSVNDRALFLILTAANLAAINHRQEAEQLLVQAAATHCMPSLLFSTEASLAASRGHWEEAGTLARKSLGKDHSNRAAREILIRALLESGHTDEALDQARELINRNGEDETTLFLLARTANAANSRQEEVEALVRLVAVARKDNQPLGASLTYLGQAYARSGARGEALRTLQEAIAAPELSEEERRTLRNAMDHLMEGDASSTTLPSVPSANP